MDEDYDPRGKPAGTSISRQEYGPGLYLTTHYDTAAKYAKGSRKLWQVVISQGTDSDSVKIPFEDVKAFLVTYGVASKRRAVPEYFARLVGKGMLTGTTFLNVITNEELVPTRYQEVLRQFLVDHGVDYRIEDNAYGWHERMVVLFNMNKIVSKKQVSRSEKLDVYDLPRDFSEAEQMQ